MNQTKIALTPILPTDCTAFKVDQLDSFSSLLKWRLERQQYVHSQDATLPLYVQVKGTVTND